MKRLFRFLPVLLAPAMVSVPPAGANPTGATVASGSVTISQSGNLLSIANSPNAIINWQSFSIGASEITRFTQQSAASAVLNRVVGAGGAIDPSVILGALQSNGRVFLINPSGIVFGAGSQIDVAGLVASSLNLSNADFLDGRLRFTEVPGAGAVVNQGAINAASGAQVYLIGPAVTNNGIITSPQGEVILAAGNSVELVNPATPSLRVEITAPGNEATNLGSIIAQSGRIGIYAGLVKSSGTLNADRAVVGPAGEILLKAANTASIEGTITAIDGSVYIEAASGITVTGGANITTTSATLIGSLCPSSGSTCGSLPPTPPIVITGGNSGGNLTLAGLQSGDLSASSGNGGSVSIGQGGGSLLLTNGGNGASLTLAAGSLTVTATTAQGDSATIPLSLLTSLGPVTLQPSRSLLTQLPVVETSTRGTAQVMGGITTISQVNDFARNPGGAAPALLMPPRGGLTHE